MRSVQIPTELILVDDGSTDGTRELLKQLEADADLVVIYHDVNRGKGAALRTGFAAATGDAVIPPGRRPGIRPAGIFPVAPTGSSTAGPTWCSARRFSGGGAHRVLYYWHLVGNRFLTLLSNMFTNLNLTDMETCYKLFRRDVIQDRPHAEARPLRYRTGTDGQGRPV